jgi:hypothetical protein
VMTLPKGVEIDLDRRTLTILGEPMVVGAAIVEDDAAVHDASWMFSLLCGENGWWIDLHVWPGSGEMDAWACCWRFVHLADFNVTAITASEVLAMVGRYSARNNSPELSAYESPFYGLVPGTWDR